MSVETTFTSWTHEVPRSVSVHPDLRFWKQAEVEAVDEPDMDVDVTLRLVFDEADLRYVVDSMVVRRRDDDSEISSAVLRSVRVQDVVRRGLQLVGPYVESTKARVPVPLPPELVQRIRQLGPSEDESLLWLARVYKVAHAMNLPPAKAVQQQLGLTTPNASIWIRRARDRGILDDDARRRSASSADAPYDMGLIFDADQEPAIVRKQPTDAGH